MNRTPPRDPRPDSRRPLSARAIAWIAALVALVGGLLVGQPASADVDPERMTRRAAEQSSLQFHYPEQYAPAIDLLDEKSGEVVPKLERGLGIESFPAVDVWVLPQVNDYYELRGQPGRAPEWAIGLSLGDKQTVIVARDTQMPGGGGSDMQKTFVHELTHVAIDIARNGGDVPRWFHEGYALKQAEEWTPERSEQLSQAASTGRLIALHDLSDTFPGHHNVASLAYAQSFDFVRFIERRHGTEAIAEVMDAVGRGTGFDKAVELSTGQTLAAMEHTWRTDLTEKTSWFAILRDDFAIFFGATLLFALAWVVRRRRNRQSYDEMDEDDDAGEWDYDESRYPLPGESHDSSS